MTDLSTPNLTALDEDRTPGKWDRVLPLGSVGIGNMSFPAPIDQTKRPGESWLQMRQRIHPELKQRDAEQEANARLCALAPDLLAEVLRLRGVLETLAAEWEREAGLANQLALGGTYPAVLTRERVTYEKCASQIRAAITPQEE